MNNNPSTLAFSMGDVSFDELMASSARLLRNHAEQGAASHRAESGVRDSATAEVASPASTRATIDSTIFDAHFSVDGATTAAGLPTNSGAQAAHPSGATLLEPTPINCNAMKVVKSVGLLDTLVNRTDGHAGDIDRLLGAFLMSCNGGMQDCNIMDGDRPFGACQNAARKMDVCSSSSSSRNNTMNRSNGSTGNNTIGVTDKLPGFDLLDRPDFDDDENCGSFSDVGGDGFAFDGNAAGSWALQLDAMEASSPLPAMSKVAHCNASDSKPSGVRTEDLRSRTSASLQQHQHVPRSHAGAAMAIMMNGAARSAIGPGVGQMVGNNGAPEDILAQIQTMLEHFSAAAQSTIAAASELGLLSASASTSTTASTTSMPSNRNGAFCIQPGPMSPAYDANNNSSGSGNGNESNVNSRNTTMDTNGRHHNYNHSHNQSSNTFAHTRGEERAARSTLNRDAESTVSFRPYQADQWNAKYKELVAFYREHKHCIVEPKDGKKLSHWVRRQRYQMKQKQDGRRSTLTDERQDLLQQINFVWDSHDAAWEYRFNDLILYRAKYGHTNVPTQCSENPSLGIWAKGQRRQYRLHCNGERSTMTESRIRRLDEVGFPWMIRPTPVATATERYHDDGSSAAKLSRR